MEYLLNHNKQNGECLSKPYAAKKEGHKKLLWATQSTHFMGWNIDGAQNSTKQMKYLHTK